MLSELQRYQAAAETSDDAIDRPMSPARTPRVLSPATIERCVAYFFDTLCRTLPILHRGSVEQMIREMDKSADAYCCIYALCAFVLSQTTTIVPTYGLLNEQLGHDSQTGLGELLLLVDITRARNGHELLETPTATTVRSFFFTSRCYFHLDGHQTGWVHLRQAITLAHVVGMDKEETYQHEDRVEGLHMRSLFWMLFLDERYSPCLVVC